LPAVLNQSLIADLDANRADRICLSN